MIDAKITAAVSAAAAVFGAITATDITNWLTGAATGLATALLILGTAWITLRKRFEDANADSLSAKLAEMTVNQEKMRESLHIVRNEQSNERARHQQEVNRLLSQLESVQESFDHLATENRMLRTEVAELRSETETLKAHINALTRATTGSSDQIDTGEHPQP